MKVEVAGGIRIEVDLRVPPLRAWALLTERQHIAIWWGGHVELQARLGGTLVETWSDGGREVVTSGEVTRCDPPRALELTWADHDWPGATRVGFHLSGHGAGTRLVLDHSGWDAHPAGERQRLIAAHADGPSPWRALPIMPQMGRGAHSMLPASAYPVDAARDEIGGHRVARQHKWGTSPMRRWAGARTLMMASARPWPP